MPTINLIIFTFQSMNSMMQQFNSVLGQNLSGEAFLNSSMNRGSIVFQLEKYTSNKVVPGLIVENMRSNTELFSHLQAMTNEIVISLVHQVYTHDAEEVIMMPRTWWDMFKDTHFSNFLKKKFPPKFREVVVKKKVFLVDGNTVDYPRKILYFVGENPLRDL